MSKSKSTRERTLELKDEIYLLYCIEGKSLFHIAEKFNIPRHTMTKVIKGELGYEPTYVKQISTDVLNRLELYKDTIIDYCNNSLERELPKLFEKIGITRGELRSLTANDNEIASAIYAFTHKTTLEELRLDTRTKREVEWAKGLIPLKGEVWADIVGYEGIYKVSSLARVHNNIKILKYTLNPVTGRNEIRLYNGDKGKQFKVYRLVAQALITNPNNLPTVNHMDGDKANDVLSNLEWSSYKEQNYHKNYILKRPIAKAYGKNGKFKKVVIEDKYEFKTLVAACEFLGVSETTIQRYLSGASKFERGIRLEYD